LEIDIDVAANAATNGTGLPASSDVAGQELNRASGINSAEVEINRASGIKSAPNEDDKVYRASGIKSEATKKTQEKERDSGHQEGALSNFGGRPSADDPTSLLSDGQPRPCR
jgi:hypothetical protein